MRYEKEKAKLTLRRLVGQDENYKLNLNKERSAEHSLGEDLFFLGLEDSLF